MVKIGFTSRKEVAKRMAELSRQTGVPLPFQCFYAGEVVDKANDVEKLIHKTFAKDRVATRKEFFSIDPDRAVSALELAKARNVTPQFQSKPSTHESKAIGKLERTKRDKTILKDLNILPGEKLTLKRGSNVVWTVVGNNKVRFGGRVQSLSSAAVEALRRLGYKTLAASGPAYWTLNGKTLWQMRRGKKDVQSRT